MFSALLSSVEAAHQAVVTEVEEKQQEAEKRVGQLMKELEKEIAELKSGQLTPEDLLDSKEYLRKVSYESVCAHWVFIGLNTATRSDPGVQALFLISAAVIMSHKSMQMQLWKLIG